jgi:uncharacterized protein (DUF1501 family)
MKRRNFLKSTALASTSIFVPSFLQGMSANILRKGAGRKKLVVIQWSGGNDGLNTVVPFANDIYYQKRPTLSIGRKEVLRLTDELGLHPALTPLRKLYDKGLLSIINNVGYPNPDRSHFRSMDIWQTGSGSEEYWSTGWLGRYLDSACQGKPVYHALEVDDGLSLAMKGEQKSGFAMSNAKRLRQVTNNRFLQKIAKNPHGEGDNVAYLYKTLIDTQSSAAYLYEQSKVHESKVTYPKSRLAKDLRQIAELMTADTETQVYYVNLGGFDTHVKQKIKQQGLLTEYAEAVDAFVKDLQQNNLLDETLILTFSEFGRRVQQNASNGTDHGTANNVFLIGGNLKKAGFYNNGPDLLNLKNNDLVFEIDFREIYTSILNNWLEVDAATVLKKQFSGLKII